MQEMKSNLWKEITMQIKSIKARSNLSMQDLSYHDDVSHACKREWDKKIEVLHKSFNIQNSFFKNHSPNLQHNNSIIMGISKMKRGLSLIKKIGRYRLRGKRFNQGWRNNDPCELKIHQWEKWSGWEESGERMKISPILSIDKIFI